MMNSDPKQDVEGGLVDVDVETKSDAGSATTAPSVESGDLAAEKEAAPKSRRWMLLGGAAAVLVVGGIVVAAVLGTCDKKETTTSKVSAESISLGGEDEAPPMYTETPNFDPPFGDVELPLFEEDVLEAYSTLEDLQDDLTKATKEMINKIVLQNIAYQSMSYNQYHGDFATSEMEEIAMQAGVGMASASAKQAAQKKVLNSMTNNQEKDVDEADIIKTDGTYVYASYGDYLVVWDLEGNLVTQDKMPTPEVPEMNEMQQQFGDFHQMDDMMPEEMEWMMWESMSYAYIDTIQMTDKHLIVLVGGSGDYYREDLIAQDGGTDIRVYNKPTAANPTLELVATRKLNGYLHHSRYLEESNSVHIVTGGDFSTYSLINDPLDIYHFDHMTSTEYYNAAKLKAETEIIPKFVKAMTEYLMVDGQLPTMMKVNSWMNAEKQTAKKNRNTVRPEDHFYSAYDDPVRSYMFVTSIQADALPTTPSEDAILDVSTTSLVGPNTWGDMYATKDSIVLNVNTYDFDPETERSEDTTHLVHLKVAADATTSFYSMASVSGAMSTTRAVDILGDDLRIATTQQKWMPLENVWPVCGDSWYFEDSCMNEDNWNDCFDVALGCQKVIKTGCPYTFECENEQSSESSTDNFISVYDISQPGEMQERGSVLIGEPHERIMGVHFGDSFSYANTFDQRDPFYVLNLPAGQAPTVAGELKLEGFSSYLQPINEDGSLVVGIGQNVTGEGMDQAPNGLLVSVFDVSDPANPKVWASNMLVDPKEHTSFSDAEFDPKAVQLNDGILAIPLTLYYHHSDNDDTWFEATDAPLTEAEILARDQAFEEQWALMESRNFDGFIVLDLTDVANQGIKEVTRISHKHQVHHNYNHNHNQEGCHPCSYNSGIAYRRAFLFDDKSLMTVQNDQVITTDLTSGNTLWSLNVTIEGEENCCY